MRLIFTTITLGLLCATIPQVAAADDGRDVVYQSPDIVIEKIDYGGSDRYQWTIETGTGGHAGTLKDAKKAARKALRDLKKAKKGKA